MSGLTKVQRKLYGRVIKNAIEDHGNFAGILQGVLKDDLLEVLTTTADIIKWFPEDSAKSTTTPLGLAVILRNKKSIGTILNAAKEKDILKEILTTVI